MPSALYHVLRVLLGMLPYLISTNLATISSSVCPSWRHWMTWCLSHKGYVFLCLLEGMVLLKKLDTSSNSICESEIKRNSTIPRDASIQSEGKITSHCKQEVQTSAYVLLRLNNFKTSTCYCIQVKY